MLYFRYRNTILVFRSEFMWYHSNSNINHINCRTCYRALRSASSNRLVAPPIKLSTNCWRPCLSDCRKSSLERSARGCRFIVIIADFPPSFKNSSFSTFIPSPDFWPFDWHRYSGLSSKVLYLRHSKNLCLLPYLLTATQKIHSSLLVFSQGHVQPPTKIDCSDICLILISSHTILWRRLL